MGILHVRVQNARDDFVLLGPVSEDGKDTVHGGIVVGEGGVKDYTWFVLLFFFPSLALKKRFHDLHSVKVSGSESKFGF